MHAFSTVTREPSRCPAERLVLSPAEIHVWLAYYDEMADAARDSACRELLDAAERMQEQQFHFARDRRRYLTTRAMVRWVLSRYVPIQPTAWSFCTNAYGRPQIANPEAMDADVSFNISHTHSLIVLAVTERRAIGVD